MFSLTRNLSMTMAAAVALAILTAECPRQQRRASGQSCAARAQQQQRAQPYKAFDGVKNNHDRFATKVDPPQEVEQTKMITK